VFGLDCLGFGLCCGGFGFDGCVGLFELCGGCLLLGEGGVGLVLYY